MNEWMSQSKEHWGHFRERCNLHHPYSILRLWDVLIHHSLGLMLLLFLGHGGWAGILNHSV